MGYPLRYQVKCDRIHKLGRPPCGGRPDWLPFHGGGATANECPISLSASGDRKTHPVARPLCGMSSRLFYFLTSILTRLASSLPFLLSCVTTISPSAGVSAISVAFTENGTVAVAFGANGATNCASVMALPNALYFAHSRRNPTPPSGRDRSGHRVAEPRAGGRDPDIRREDGQQDRAAVVRRIGEEIENSGLMRRRRPP